MPAEPMHQGTVAPPIRRQAESVSKRLSKARARATARTTITDRRPSSGRIDEELIERAGFDAEMFTLVVKPEHRERVLKALSGKPANIPDVKLPDVEDDPLLTNIKHKVKSMQLKVAPVAKMIKELYKLDRRVVILLMNAMQILATIEAEEGSLLAQQVDTLFWLMDGLAELGKLQRSTKSMFRVALLQQANAGIDMAAR